MASQGEQNDTNFSFVASLTLAKTIPCNSTTIIMSKGTDWRKFQLHVYIAPASEEHKARTREIDDKFAQNT